MKINVIGLGYIGLPTSLILASNGVEVLGTDLNASIVNKLNEGKVTFEESGLVNLYNKAVENNVKFSTNYSNDAEVYIVTVPTPYDVETKKIDPKYLISAVKEIVNQSNRDTILVVESTVSPGTIDQYVRPLLVEARSKIDLVHAPERILPGAMIDELVNNPRTIGSDDPKIGQIVKNLYEKFCKAEIVVTSIGVAEMSKVVENTFRDVNIAFANELAQICHEANLDVQEVIRISNMHPRVNILSPGPGVGGHCISVDPWFLVGDYPNLTHLIKQARETNDTMPKYILERLRKIMLDNGLSDYSKVGVYGLTYKENVDDTRESPSLQFYNFLEGKEKDIKFFDPYLESKILDSQVLDFDEFITNLDLMVVFVNHNHLNSINLPDNLIVFDTKNSNLKLDKKYSI